MIVLCSSFSSSEFEMIRVPNTLSLVGELVSAAFFNGREKIRTTDVFLLIIVAVLKTHCCVCRSHLCPAEQSLWTISWLSWQRWRRMQGVTTWRQWMRWPGRAWQVLPSTWASQVRVCLDPHGLRSLIWFSFSQAERTEQHRITVSGAKPTTEFAPSIIKHYWLRIFWIFWLRKSDIPFTGYYFRVCRLQDDWLASPECVELIQFTGNTTKIHHFN